MPVLKNEIGSNVIIDWQGAAFTQRVQRAIRAALRETGEALVEEARKPENVRRDTETLAANIEYRVPRRAGGSTTYRLEFGVFEDGKNILLGKRRQPAWTYAFWQEILPDRGRPYIRPAVQAEGQPDQIIARVQERLTYRSGRELPFEGTVDRESFGFDQ